jgi:hypothetical protein
MDNAFDMQCPSCGKSDQIDVYANVWVSLSRHGSDDNGDHEWYSESQAICRACNHAGTVEQFIDAYGEYLDQKSRNTP